MFEKLKSFDESTIQLRLLFGSVRYIYINLIQSSQTCPINVIKVCQTKHSVKGMIKHLDWFKKNKKTGSVPKFWILPQNPKNLQNTYQFWWKYLPKTCLLIRKKPTLTHISEGMISCAFTVTEPKESSRKSWNTIGLVIKDKKHEN